MQRRVERVRVIAPPEGMTPTIVEILEEHVTFELESPDRFYLNG